MGGAPLRVLHVIGGLNRGGLEAWLMYLLRRVDRTRLEMDFLVHTDKECPYDAEALSLKARILYSSLHPPWSNVRQLWSTLRRPIRYDVVHSHTQHYSGWVLSIAALAGIPVRIAHSHLDTRSEDQSAGLSRRFYISTMDTLLHRSATAGFACSTEAGKALYGSSWGRDPRWSLLPYGVDLRPFQVPIRTSMRDDLGIPRDAFVIGHAARFVPFKNHAFIVAIAKEIAALDPAPHFLIVGDGVLRGDTERLVAEAGLKNRFTFTGERGDVAALMTSAMDAFVFPSFYEGLPVTLVEAQAAGLPCLVSKNVSAETSIVDGLFLHESLESPPSVWARRLLQLPRKRTDEDRKRALRTVSATPFEVRTNLETLHQHYLKLLNENRHSRPSRVGSFEPKRDNDATQN
jgi:glycosyltransferase involved in cell wall biosynthesis